MSVSAWAQSQSCPDSYATMQPGSVCGNPSVWADGPVAIGATQLNQGHIAVLKRANMQISTDQPFVGMTIPGAYRITGVAVTNCSASPSGAVGGIYTAVSKGGTAIVAASQTYTALASATAVQDLTVVAGVLPVREVFTAFWFSLTTPLGSASLCDIYIDGIGFP
jgi:hypothetical protein